MARTGYETTPTELALHRDMAFEIRSIRESMGYSLAETSRLTGIISSTITCMEDRTDDKPALTSMRSLCKFADAMDCVVEFRIIKRNRNRKA